MDPQTQMMVTAILSAVTSSGVMSLILYFIQKHDKKKEREEANGSAQAKMLLGLGHDKLIHLTDKFVRRGAITLKEKRNLEFLYIPYAELGGNGDCKIGYDACQKLQVISDEEAEVRDAHFKRKEYGIEA